LIALHPAVPDPIRSEVNWTDLAQAPLVPRFGRDQRFKFVSNLSNLKGLADHTLLLTDLALYRQPQVAIFP
jgi:hypothetical protein